MPHLILEYSNNLAEPVNHQTLFAELHATLQRFNTFQDVDIQSRAIAYEHYCVGSGVADSVFVHLTVAILSGRDLALRQQIGTELVAILRRAFTQTWRERPCDVTVEVREMQRETYGKAMNEAASAIAGRTV